MDNVQIPITVHGIHTYLTQVLGVREIVLAEPSADSETSHMTEKHETIVELRKEVSPLFCLMGEALTDWKFEFWVATSEDVFSLEEQELTLKMVEATKIDINTCKVLWSSQSRIDENLKTQSKAPFVVIFSDGAIAGFARHQVVEQGAQKMILTYGPQSVGKNQENKKRVWNDLKKMMTLWSI